MPEETQEGIRFGQASGSFSPLLLCEHLLLSLFSFQRRKLRELHFAANFVAYMLFAKSIERNRSFVRWSV
jgi:hypothetical protein